MPINQAIEVDRKMKDETFYLLWINMNRDLKRNGPDGFEKFFVMKFLSFVFDVVCVCKQFSGR